MRRRGLLQAPFALGLTAPALAATPGAGRLRVVPQANLTSLDPVWTTAVVTRNHAFMVYDQICAQDAQGTIRPQMAEGWVVEADGLAWTFTLREGLRFHDGEPVRARDCAASIRRWARRVRLPRPAGERGRQRGAEDAQPRPGPGGAARGRLCQ
ncbi:hypothetical protein DOO78_19775 [Roseicella frigidaeris]|uniref:Solute-binding protein family 5 domain-containing protein n=1 Tax=Roseicella frigidaeris TaxID=2230885 RepID=A0A327M425_9PROT|nr:ABC transporter substrate-binding protein [Roseicella frigidaeris]RAI57266.1 hypothetical protein DOO78_19775 [Roseicella frigidaeris]